jgi:hypothetical protein
LIREKTLCLLKPAGQRRLVAGSREGGRAHQLFKTCEHMLYPGKNGGHHCNPHLVANLVAKSFCKLLMQGNDGRSCAKGVLMGFLQSSSALHGGMEQ